MTTLSLRRVSDLDAARLEGLVRRSEREGFRFLRRLLDEWETGATRFEGAVEALWLARIGSRPIGTCGLNRDPFAEDPKVGRLRRLYVDPRWRRIGVAATLTQAALADASASFTRIRLRTDSAGAAAFYARRGFRTVETAEATHELDLVRTRPW